MLVGRTSFFFGGGGGGGGRGGGAGVGVGVMGRESYSQLMMLKLSV